MKRNEECDESPRMNFRNACQSNKHSQRLYFIQVTKQVTNLQNFYAKQGNSEFKGLSTQTNLL